MNLKKAKALRKLSRSIFIQEKTKNKDMKDINLDTKLWTENISRKKTTEEQDYGLVQAFDDNGVAVKNEDGTPKLIPSPKVNDLGEPVMRKIEWAPGTISCHPLSSRGIYRNIKKNLRKNVLLSDIKQQIALLEFQTLMLEKQQHQT